ncbi:MAG: DMT family transporter [Clostridia bacterium]|nr:DMT family transporter [Clostridia bacterium]
MKTKTFTGHLAALFTIIVWGTTLISSTKLLTGGFSPAEVIICRFLLAFVLLNIIYPPRLKFEGIKREMMYAVSGLLGVTLYFFLEIVALQYTKAANASVIFATAPFFCGIFSLFSKKADKPKLNFFIGFALAITGIILVTFEEGFTFDLNVQGALFAIGSAVSWGLYSLLTKTIGTYGHNVIQTTRRIFMYGLIFMIPTVFIFDVDIKHFALLADMEMLFNMLYLALCASGVCFLTWSKATNTLGPVKATTYIYGTPLVTIVFSYFFLRSQTLTAQLFIGAALIIAGLVISVTKSSHSEKKKAKRRKR